MSATWTTIVALAAATAAIRAAGPVLLGGRRLPAPLRSVIALLAPALLAALIVTETVGGEGGDLDLDERVAGLGAAAAVLIVRESAVLAAIFVAAAVTAGARALL